MNNEYKYTKTTVSLINYYFVFCPRCRRKIFNIQGLEQRFKELTIAECTKCGIEILALECHVDHVHIFVSVLPTMSIPNIVQRIKGCTSLQLREEFAGAYLFDRMTKAKKEEIVNYSATSNREFPPDFLKGVCAIAGAKPGS